MPNPFRWSFRLQYRAGLLLCVALLGYALYVQYALYLDPCPLCIFQRVAFIVMGVFFLLGALHNPGRAGRKIYAVLVGVGASAGIGVAGRHVWLQSLPADQVPACGPSLDYMLEAFPIGKTLQMVFTGSGECANADWHFLGLAMPAWTLIMFVVLGLAALWAGWKRR